MKDDRLQDIGLAAVIVCICCFFIAIGILVVCIRKDSEPLYNRAVMNIGYTSYDVAIESYDISHDKYVITDVDGNVYLVAAENCTLIQRGSHD